jgi:hypothetical protein
MNKTMIYFTFPLVMISAGCSTSTVIDRYDDNTVSTLSVGKFNQQLQGKSVTIRLKNGHQYNAMSVIISRDSTEYQDSQIWTSVSNDSIQQFEWKDHLGGSLDGSLLTVIPAVILGVSWHGIGGEEHPGISIETGSLIVVGGFLVGLTSGHRNYYEFSSEGRTSQNAGKIEVRTSTAHNTQKYDARQ